MKQAQILRSEAQRMESINMAKGEAEAILSVAEARANSIRTISQALLQKVHSLSASYNSKLLITEVGFGSSPIH